MADIPFDDIVKCVQTLDLGNFQKDRAMRDLRQGKFTIHINVILPDPYDNIDSSICWGWLAYSSGQYYNGASGKYDMYASYGDGERGSEPYDPDTKGLHIWITDNNKM